MKPDQLSLPRKLLLAAEDLIAKGQKSFRWEALAVAAWAKFPEAFGLHGFLETYPDSNKVLNLIVGQKGLVRRGWLVKKAESTYGLARGGLLELARLHGKPEPIARTRKLHGAEGARLRVLLDSQAAAKLHEGQLAEVTFTEACDFWAAYRERTLLGRVTAVGGLLRRLVEQFAEGCVDAELVGGRVVSLDELRALANLHQQLQRRFDRHIVSYETWPATKAKGA